MIGWLAVRSNVVIVTVARHRPTPSKLNVRGWTPHDGSGHDPALHHVTGVALGGVEFVGVASYLTDAGIRLTLFI